ncbi:SusC/RagA family TonB-linked outer membrane protein [Hymenobacter defluvii]|uniref:TonB-dependent receptor n=1 Tax=Hymenobacter defluvii TaxID=2054411 RepID=A0ABS3TB95_9BACT|nr:TonB-dependent receptor [Hymenobacter defluvii]MBO3270463.1 TonB-dependent receptor [Hymenobacter defluvii]
MLKNFYSRMGAARCVLTRPVCLGLLSLSLVAWTSPEQAQLNIHQRVSVQLQGKTLRQTLQKLSTVAHVPIAYANTLPLDRKVTVQATNEQLDDVLNRVLQPLQLRYRVVAERILVEPLPITKPTSAAPASVVEGTVLDAQAGGGLPGVNVLVKGTTTGTVTDAQGRYQLTVPDGATTLVYSFIGYLTQEVALDNRATVNIRLAPDTKSLEEVVVVGYGTQKKVNLTGAVSNISATDIADRPITNPTSALQGLMPGVTVVNSSALPGSNGNSIRIRGIGTLGNANPLVVIDGVPGGDLDILNPNDIESISVLKDAASSSIYGVRGANGVILVTTKRGKEGAAPALTYTNYIGFQTPTALPKTLGSVDYMTLLNEAQRNVGRVPTYTDAEIETARNGSDPNYFANTNWIKEIYKKSAPQQNHNVSLNGGAKNLTYYLSYGNLKEGGLITGDNYQARRNNVRVRLSTTLADRLDLDANLGYINREVQGSSEGVGSNSGPLYATLQILPLVPVRFTTGGWGYIGGQRNPVAVTTDGGTNNFRSQELTANMRGTLRLFDGFRLRGQYGLVTYSSKRNIFSKTINYYSPLDNSLIYQTNAKNTISSANYMRTYQTFIGMAEYEKSFADQHDVKLLLAASQESTVGEDLTASRQSLPTQSVGAINLGTENQLNNGQAYQNALRSVFGRANYIFKDRYLLEGNFRYDGSSRFSPDVRWNLFGSGSVGWIFSEEAFFAGLRDVVPLAKIRASYGTQGNDLVGSDYPYLATIGPVSTMPIGNQQTLGYAQTDIPNTLLTWESVQKTDVGIDLGLLRNRLTVSGDYFINRTNDILLRVALPDVLGATEPSQNAGKVENKGWEVQASWRDQVGQFTYGLSGNLSDVRNKVVSLGGTPPTFGDRVRFLGEPIDAFYGLVADRIAQTSDFDLDAGTNRYTPRFPVLAGDPAQPGDLIYKDLNGDGVISLDQDRKVIGSAIPRYTYGVRANAAWHGIDATIFFQGVGQADGYIYGPARHAYISEGSLPQEIHLDRWTPENTGGSYPRLTYQQSHNQRLSTYWLEDASYLRLKNVQVGYTLPASLTQRVRVSRLRLYASADNLFTRSDFFYGYDPESPVSQGGFYPQVKTVVFGLNVTLQ